MAESALPPMEAAQGLDDLCRRLVKEDDVIEAHIAGRIDRLPPVDERAVALYHLALMLHAECLTYAALWVTVNMARVVRGNSIVATTIEHVVDTPADLATLLALYTKLNEGPAPLSGQMKKGVQRVLEKFPLERWQQVRPVYKPTLTKAILLTHPKPMQDGVKQVWEQMCGSVVRK